MTAEDKVKGVITIGHHSLADNFPEETTNEIIVKNDSFMTETEKIIFEQKIIGKSLKDTCFEHNFIR